MPELRTLNLLRFLHDLWQRISSRSTLRFQVKPRRLKLQETVQLGEKRFVAILRVDGQEFLLGGGTTGVSILGQLYPEPAAMSFSAVLEQHHAQEEQA